MKKLICLIFAAFFYILGIIGMLIPIVPQVPFLVIGTVFLVLGFKTVKEKIIKSKIYNKHIKETVEKNKILRAIFEIEK